VLIAAPETASVASTHGQACNEPAIEVEFVGRALSHEHDEIILLYAAPEVSFGGEELLDSAVQQRARNALSRAGQLAALRISTATGAALYAETFPARAERGGGLPDVDRLPYFPEVALALLADMDAVAVAGAEPPIAYFGYEDVPSVLTRPGTLVQLARPHEDAEAALLALADRIGGDDVPVPAPAAPEPPGDGEALTSCSRLNNRLQPHGDSPLGHHLLCLSNGVLAKMKNAGGQRGVGLAEQNRVRQVLGPPGSAAGDDRNRHRLTDGTGHFQIVPVLGSVAIHAG